MDDSKKNNSDIDIAPWGSPETPLLPESLRTLWSDERLPVFVTEDCQLPRDSTIATLRAHLLLVPGPAKRTRGSSEKEYEDVPISKLNLSVRSSKCLANAKIETVGELIQTPEATLLRRKNFGRKSLSEIKDVLSSMGLQLGMASDATEDLAEAPVSERHATLRLMSKPVDDLVLSVRSRRCLREAHIETVGELSRMNEEQLLQLETFGRKCLNEIRGALDGLGLRLGMRVSTELLGRSPSYELGSTANKRSQNFVVNLVASRQNEIVSVKVFCRPWPPSVSTDKLPWRRRTRNCLMQARLLTGSRTRLSGLTFGDLFKIPGMGVRSVLDFACVSEMAVEKAAEIEQSVYSANSVKLFKDTYRKLEALIDEPWSTEVSGQDARFQDTLLAWDGTVYDQLEVITGDQESLSRALRLAESVEGLISSVKKISAMPLDEALEDFVGETMGFGTEKTRAFMRRFGFGGDAPATLEAVGTAMGLTRERVRQLESRLNKGLPEHSVFMPKLDAAMDLVVASAPIDVGEAARLVQDKGISRRPFDPRSLLAAAAICKKRVDFRVERIKGNSFVVAKHQSVPPRNIVSIALRQAGASGMSNVAEVVAQAASKGITYDEAEVGRILKTMPSIEFIYQGWFWHPSGKPERNRLRNVTRKMLSVVSPIDVSVVREGLRRVYRWRNSTSRVGAWPLVVPPRVVLVRFFEANPEFHVSESGQLSSEADLDFSEELGQTEKVLVEILRSSPACVLDRASLRGACTKRGLLVTTLDSYLTYSPIIAHLGTDIWSLRGVRVHPEAVDAVRQANADRPREKRVIDHGWTDKGMLWVAARLPRDMVNFVFGLPAAVFRYTEGREFLARDDEGTDCGRIRFSGSTSYGYGPFLRRRGGDEGDIFIAEFDLVTGTVLLRLEDDEFLEELSPAV